MQDFYVEELVRIQKELSCDTIVSSGQIVAQFPCEYTVDCLTSNQSREGFGAIFPCCLPAARIEELKSLAARVVQGLGVDSGYFHLEFFLTSDGILFGEVGARLAGGLHIATESLAVGRDLRELYLDLFLKERAPERPSLPLEMTPGYLGYYLYPKKAGRVAAITDRLKDAPWVLAHSVETQVGDRFEWEDASVARIATAVFRADSEAEIQERMKVAPSLLDVTWES